MTTESNTRVDLDSNANQEPLNDNESCNWNFIPSLTLLDFEWKFKKPKPQHSATSGTFENFPGIWQSPYYTRYYKQKCHNMSRTDLPSNDNAVDSV